MEKRPFRPVESLIVFGVVAILSVTLSPIFARDGRAASKRGCVDRMKQISAALAQYVDANDRLFPPSYDYRLVSSGKFQRTHWSALVGAYLPDWDTFRCPSDPYRLPIPASDGLRDLQAPVQSYVANDALLAPMKVFLPVSSDVVGNPAGVIAFGDRQARLGSAVLKAYAGTSGFVPSHPQPGQPYRRATFADLQAALAARSDLTVKLARVAWNRHHGASNFAFADGHVRPLSARATLDPTKTMWGEKFYPTR